MGKYIQKKRMGVPVGYKHSWVYSKGPWVEKKGKGNRWIFNWKSTKKRGGSEKGGPPVGYKVMWKINGVQRAIKTGPRKYKTEMVGKKKLLGYFDPKNKKWRRNKN